MGGARSSNRPDSRLCLWSPCGSGVSRTQLLTPLGICRVYTDGWGSYHRHVDPHQHVVSTRMTKQRERNQLTLRTWVKRLVRKTLCFSRSIEMHESVIGLFVN